MYMRMDLPGGEPSRSRLLEDVYIYVYVYVYVYAYAYMYMHMHMYMCMYLPGGEPIRSRLLEDVTAAAGGSVISFWVIGFSPTR